MSDRRVHFEGVDVQLRFCRGTVASTDRESKPAVDRFKARICTEAVPWELSKLFRRKFISRSNESRKKVGEGERNREVKLSLDR